MNAHLHLLLNHFPIIIPILSLAVLLAGFAFRSKIIKRTTYSLFILGALCTIPAFLSGEGTEEAIENIQGIDEPLIEVHEETADVFAILSYVLGGIALASLLASWKRKSYASGLSILTGVFCLVVLFYVKNTGTSGGDIRHSEIRSNSTESNPTNKETPVGD